MVTDHSGRVHLGAGVNVDVPPAVVLLRQQLRVLLVVRVQYGAVGEQRRSRRLDRQPEPLGAESEQLAGSGQPREDVSFEGDPLRSFHALQRVLVESFGKLFVFMVRL